MRPRSWAPLRAYSQPTGGVTPSWAALSSSMRMSWCRNDNSLASIAVNGAIATTAASRMSARRNDEGFDPRVGERGERGDRDGDRVGTAGDNVARLDAKRMRRATVCACTKRRMTA